MKKILDKYFITAALTATGLIVFTWAYVLTMHPFITISALVVIILLLKLTKKIKRSKSS